MTATILLVEDNPITRKLVRFTLEKEGFVVVDAPDAKSALEAFPRHAISLVLQDLCLPDMDGFELLSRLRRLPGGTEVPILLFSGMLSHHDEAKVSAAGFDDLISKPIEPSRLVQIVRAHLPAADDASPDHFGTGRRIVVADDDPVQRKLVGFRMKKIGFEVFLAADGGEALQKVRSTRPHVVLSDVLMPGVDGFRLCVELKRDPSVAAIPIVLTTNSYVEPTDRDLARKAGAHDLVLRTPDLADVLTAVRASLKAPRVPVEQLASITDIETEHMRRMVRQLDRQVALNAGISQRCAVLAAEMSVLRGISDALASHEDIDDALRHTLAACFDAGGISLGALYVKDGDALRVLSFGFSADWSEDELSRFFGERDLLDAAIRDQSTLVFASGTETEGQRMLRRARVASALVVPVGYKGHSHGALVMLSRNGELRSDDRIKFAEAVAGQISQAIAVAHAFREKERSERAASEQAAVLRSILESIGDGVLVSDEAGTIIHCNRAATHLMRLGMGAPQDPHGVFTADQKTPLPLEELPLVRATKGESVDGLELFVRHEDAPEGVWLSVSGRPWCDDRGTRRGGVAVFRDVTRDKLTQSQLIISDRMASVGMLAAGVAHEINNPLACVLGNLELLHDDFSSRAVADDENMTEIHEMLDDARSAADRVREIIRDLRIFSRHEETRSGPVDLEKVIDSSLRMAWNEIRHRARLVKSYRHSGLAEGSESRLGQVFLNLIVNAAQAIPPGNAHAHTLGVTTFTDQAGRMVVEVSDTGTGIPTENLGHLFRPFFTTKGPGVGTGLGLAICHRIVTGLGGEIHVTSVVDQGTTFRVVLMPARGEAQRIEPATPHMLPAVRRGRVLVVDDEPMVAAMIRRVLSSEHDISSTTVASDALELFRAGASFDIILCDLMMPHMTGMELYAELLEIAPKQASRVVFLTGGAFTPSARTFLDEVQNKRLDKPFDAKVLRQLVNDSIG